MATDPDKIDLNDEQRRKLAQAADDTGKSWSEVLEESLKRYRSAHPSNGGGEKPKAKFGAGQGLISISDDFDEPLEDFREYTE